MPLHGKHRCKSLEQLVELNHTMIAPIKQMQGPKILTTFYVLIVESARLANHLRRPKAPFRPSSHLKD